MLNNGIVESLFGVNSSEDTFKQIKNNCKELVINLIQPLVKHRRMKIRFRLFDDGLGFRYEFPAQTDLTYFTVSEEITEFALTGDHKTFWIPGDYEANEYAYTTSKLSEVNALKGLTVDEIFARTAMKNKIDKLISKVAHEYNKLLEQEETLKQALEDTKARIVDAETKMQGLHDITNKQ